MGYAARTVSAQDVKNGVFATVGCHMVQTNAISNTPTEVFKMTVNFNDIDYLRYRYTNEDNATGNTNAEIKIGGVSKVDVDNQADGIDVNGQIDCTAITGELALTIECDNTLGGGGLSWLTNIYFFNREA